MPVATTGPSGPTVTTPTSSAPTPTSSAPTPASPTPASPTPPVAAAPGRRRAGGPLARLRRRLWHRLLTPGWIRQTPAARLRGWARVLDWEDADGAGRLRLVKRAVWTPVRAWKEAGHGVAECGASLESATGVSRRAQRLQMWWLGLRHGIVPPTYVEYQLYRPERRRRAAEFLQEPEHTRLLRWMHRASADAHAAIFRDKPRFSAWCRDNELPSVPTLLEFDHGAVVASSSGGLGSVSLPACDLFSKPNDATAGHGTQRWRHLGAADGVRRWAATDGRVVTEEELLAELAHTSLVLPLREGRSSRRMLLQPCLRNHRDLLALTPGALCTARILVFRFPGEPARVVRAAYRMATGNASADNYAVGGIVAPIDVETGRLGAAIERRDHVIRPIDRHPDTGAVIQGHQIPCWPEAVALALRGLDATRGLPTLGWDVAITDDGPVMIEGNLAPNPGIVQKAIGLPLSDTPLPAALDAHMRLLLGA